MKCITGLLGLIFSEIKERCNASWNTEANTCVSHHCVFFKVILSVTFQLFGMQNNGVITV